MVLQRSDLHAHQLLVGLQGFIANFGHELECQLGLVHSDHDLMDVVLLSRDKGRNLLVCLLLHSIHAVHCIFEELAEVTSSCLSRLW